MGYLLTGRHFSATRAFELGLVNDVVPLSALRETTEGYVEDILQCAPLAVRATKASSMQGLDHSLRDAFNRTYPEEMWRGVPVSMPLRALEPSQRSAHQDGRANNLKRISDH